MQPVDGRLTDQWLAIECHRPRPFNGSGVDMSTTASGDACLAVVDNSSKRPA
jgi:hypothetical protein